MLDKEIEGELTRERRVLVVLGLLALVVVWFMEKERIMVWVDNVM